MRLYFQFVANAVKSNTTYRINTFFRLISELMSLFVQVFIWKSLLKGGSATSQVGSIRLDEMITYVVISLGISILTSTDVIGELNNRIRSGGIAFDFIRPFSIKLNVLCAAVGQMIAAFIIRFIPVFAVALTVFDIGVPGIGDLCVFFAAAGLGFVLYLQITYLVALSGFWYIEMWHMNRFLSDVIRIFSGAWLPLWFFPDALYRVSSFLPFRLMYYFPISVYLGKIGPDETRKLLLQQVLWIAAVMLMSALVWKSAQRKLVVQGG